MSVGVDDDIQDMFGDDNDDIQDMFGSEPSNPDVDHPSPGTTTYNNETQTPPITPTPSKEENGYDQDMQDMFGSDSKPASSFTSTVASNGAGSPSADSAQDSTSSTGSRKRKHSSASKRKCDSLTTTCASSSTSPAPATTTNGRAPTVAATAATAALLDEAAARKLQMRHRAAQAILLQQKHKKKTQGSSHVAIPTQPKASKSTTLKRRTSSAFYRPVEVGHYYKNIRDWDFVTDLNNSQKRPPVSTTTTNNEALPDTFESCSQYKGLWSPLLLKEVQSQILTDTASELVPLWSRGGAVTPVRVQALPSTTSTTSSFGDAVLTLLIKTDDGGRSRNDAQQQQQPFFVNGIVLLVTDASVLFEASQGKLAQLASSVATDGRSSEGTTTKRSGILGHVVHHARKLDGLQIKVSQKHWKCFVGKVVGVPEMFLSRIGSNVTALREFTALCKMDYIPLKKCILSARPPSTANEQDHPTGAILSETGGEHALGVGFRIAVKARFNNSQIEAITAAAKEYGRGGFTLVKGPPGTGKTTTLVAMLNALHLRQYQIYYNEIERIAATATGARGNASSGMFAFNLAARVKPRILVCAPSNAAVDNVILKITEKRFTDGTGGRYSPSIVRVGVGQSSAVGNVSLKTQVDSVLAEGADHAKLDNLIQTSKAELRRFESEMKKIQQRIQALVEATPPGFVLSRDWEIRIDEATFNETKRGLFVNHRLKTTTLDIPLPCGPNEVPYPTKEMPHYKSLMDTMVKYVERHSNMTSKLKQLYLVKNTNSVILQDGRFSHAAASLLHQLETHLLDSAHIVMTTLGSAGSKAIEAATKFEVVVVDEAAQSSEPATLAALQLGSSHAVLMGDPQQLPATIFSVSGRNTKYDRSLFQRLEEAGHPVHMLNIQYRMDPAISDFPRRIFYDGRLLDGSNVRNPLYGGVLSKTLGTKFPYFQPFTILDLNSAEEREGTSLSNAHEVELALHLYCTLEKETCGMLSKCRVAVITPYSQQVTLLRRAFSNQLDPSLQTSVEISTIDAFQGKEADVVVFSCVRAAGRSVGIGFLSDVQRMNVALTRAKHFLFVIARVRTIIVNPYWRDLVAHARERRSIIRVPLIAKNKSCETTSNNTSRRAGAMFPELRSLEPLHPASFHDANDRNVNDDNLSDGEVSA